MKSSTICSLATPGIQCCPDMPAKRVMTGLVMAQESLRLGSGVLRAVSRVEDQARDRDVLTGVEGGEPAVGLLLPVDVGGAGLGVDARPEPEPGGRPGGDDRAHNLLQASVRAGGKRGGGDLPGAGHEDRLLEDPGVDGRRDGRY